MRYRFLNDKRLIPYLYLLPFMLLFLGFTLFPLLFSLWMALHSATDAGSFLQMSFSGLENFRYLLEDDWFHVAVYNTLWIALVSGLPQHLIAIPLATYLYRHSRRRNLLSLFLFFLPYLTSSVAIALVFNALFSRDYGLINQWLAALWGLVSPASSAPQPPIDWYDAEHIRWLIALVVCWKNTGWNTLIYLAAMRTVNKDLFEAASLEGAGFWKQLRIVVLPNIKPVMLLALGLTLIGNLQLFDEAYLLTSGTGGSGQSGLTVMMYIFNLAFIDGDYSLASAAAWLLTLLLLILLPLLKKGTRDETT